jgi:4-hydroxyphenylpyruvate dioxygenase-like putative hemolysin
MVIGVYMSGSIANNEAWEAKVKEVESKLAEAEAQGAKETIKIVEKVVVQEKIVRQRGQDIVKIVEKEVVKYDNKCEIPPPFIEIHNQAAEKVK